MVYRIRTPVGAVRKVLVGWELLRGRVMTWKTVDRPALSPGLDQLAGEAAGGADCGVIAIVEGCPVVGDSPALIVIAWR